MSKQRPQIPLTTGKRLGPRKSTSGSNPSLGNSPRSAPILAASELTHDSAGHSCSPQITPEPNEILTGELSGVRRGSPFAEGTARKASQDTTPGIQNLETQLTLVPATLATDPLWGRSISSETASGATVATWFIFPLSLLATSVFPAGAVIVSLLGMVLALFGIASRWHRISLAALFSHLLCAGFAYSKIVA